MFRMATFTSYGTCSLCGKNISKAAMTRHLKVCAPGHDLSGGRCVSLFHLRIEDAYSPYFWLDLEMQTGGMLSDLDDFLREIWLECCGHLSDFDIGGVSYSACRVTRDHSTITGVWMSSLEIYWLPGHASGIPTISAPPRDSSCAW